MWLCVIIDKEILKIIFNLLYVNVSYIYVISTFITLITCD